MTKQNSALTALLLVMLTLAGCNRAADDSADRGSEPANISEAKETSAITDSSKTLVTVNNTAITQRQYEVFVRILDTKISVDQIDPEKKQQILNEMVERVLLQQYALDNGLESEPQLAIALQQQRQLLLALAAKKQMLDNIGPLSDEQIQARYELEKERAHPNEYHIQHISVASEEEAGKIIEKLAAGEDFSALAKEFSLDESKENGGDIGWVGQASTSPEVLSSVALMQNGEWSKKPLQAGNGWQVLKLVDTRPVTFLEIEQARPRLQALLQRERLLADIQALRDAAKIELVETAQATENPGGQPASEK